MDPVLPQDYREEELDLLQFAQISKLLAAQHFLCNTNICEDASRTFVVLLRMGSY